ncbi:FAD-dependent oxidoreductase [Streptomyces platensis]|uniref:FAD-dependent oxidoreductase n=1 Tax=Streptomyces platensis TaxID=58346 RepID=A0AAE6TQT2_STRPT|nr:FAD-dependent oxidoreductase [Streptomyces platensis]OSY48382.1 Flavin-dependent L-tryptophan oxidase RebO precursor [Streptomyces platensis]QEV55995.1 FAD-dependent oxidoreductase [Streptomyces platensis]
MTRRGTKRPAADTPVDDSAKALRHAMSGLSGPEATGWTGTVRPAGTPGKGAKVLILGAGVAGLTAAYELSMLDYQVTVLEAQDRIGGRNRTARRGDQLYELDAHGTPTPTHRCEFDEGLYLNLGPGRIPYHHRRVLKYCRDFGVALEPYVMETTANRVRPPHADVTWPNRRVANDTRGHLAAKLAETLNGRDAFTGELRDLLRVFGALDANGKYRGSTRSGYLDSPEIAEWPVPAPPLSFEDLVHSGFWKTRFYQPVDHLWQATMFQPVGGMDHIVTALAREAKRAGAKIVLGAEVREIEIGPRGLAVSLKYRKGDDELQADARYCVSNIPVPVLRTIKLTRFSDPFEQALRVVEFEKTCKVGWQANRRFWEGDLGGCDDTEGIYGGISWTGHNITQMWYPSNDYFSAKGTLTGAYNFGTAAETLGKLTPEKRLQLAREGAVQLHPEFKNKELVPDKQGISIAWHKVPYQLGGWAAWEPQQPAHKKAYKQLLRPEGTDAFFVTGDQISPLPGWQEGAMMSAHYVVQQILGIMPLTAPEEVAVPDSVALTQGLF